MPRERREEHRQSLEQRARLRLADARPAAPAEAIIEERSAKGLRLTSFTPLLPDAVIVLQPRGDLDALRARVVWAQRGSGSWKAGCRLLGVPSMKASRGDPALVREPGARTSKALAVAGLLALAALVVYAFVRFTTLIAESVGR